MQFEAKQKDPKCLVSAASGWLGLMNFVFGSVTIDDTRYAKIGLQGSLREIDSSEEELKVELEGVIARIKATQGRSKNMDRVKPLLMQHKKIRNRIEILERKRGVLQNHMETLENSELNQQVLYSMQRTSNALKAMGIDKSLQSVDKVMLDLEENHNDMNSLQQTLGTSYTEDEDTDWGLELTKIMSDECCVTTPEMMNSTSHKDGARADVPTEVRRVREPEACVAEEASEAADVKKAEHAVIA
jgi:hypothetical protein